MLALALLPWDDVDPKVPVDEIISQHNLLTFLTLAMLVVVAAVLGIIIGLVRKINLAMARLTMLSEEVLAISHSVNGPMTAVAVASAAERHVIHAEQQRVRAEKVADDAERHEAWTETHDEQNRVREEQDRVRAEKADEDDARGCNAATPGCPLTTGRCALVRRAHPACVLPSRARCPRAAAPCRAQPGSTCSSQSAPAQS